MSDDHDAIVTGREGGLKSGRSRRIQGFLATGQRVIIEDLPDMTEFQVAVLRSGLVNLLRDIDDRNAAKSD